VRMHFP